MAKNIKAYSLIDRYSSGERVVHDLTEKNYGAVFEKVLADINALEGDAKVEFEQRSVSLWINAMRPQASSTIAAHQARSATSFRSFSTYGTDSYFTAALALSIDEHIFQYLPAATQLVYSGTTSQKSCMFNSCARSCPA